MGFICAAHVNSCPCVLLFATHVLHLFVLLFMLCCLLRTLSIAHFRATCQFCSTSCVWCTFAMKAVSSGLKITVTLTCASLKSDTDSDAHSPLNWMIKQRYFESAWREYTYLKPSVKRISNACILHCCTLSVVLLFWTNKQRELICTFDFSSKFLVCESEK